jgi:hypothetical protein
MTAMSAYRSSLWCASAVFACVSLPALAQPGFAPGYVDSQASPSGTLGPAALEKLVAPVALYPDSVLTDILAAATDPAEVVEAARFLADPANNGLTGAALAGAVEGHDWDPGVAALIEFPPVLQMMDSQLEWTEHLGRAFTAQQADVMNAVQHLRQLAEAAGTLKNGPREEVVDNGGIITIDPGSNQGVYLPTYDPACVYGRAPGCDAADDELGWDDGIYLPYGYWQWAVVDWPGHRIRLQRGGGNNRRLANDNISAGDFWHASAPRVVAASARFGGNDGYLYAPPPAQAFVSHAAIQHAVAPVHHAQAGGFRRAPVARGGSGRR